MLKCDLAEHHEKAILRDRDKAKETSSPDVRVGDQPAERTAILVQMFCDAIW